MTKQEAIALVREVSNYMATRPEIDEAIDMAIEALEQEPCEDAVSREAVLDKAYAYGNGSEPEGYCVEVEDIQALPSVVPTRKKGSDTE